MPTPFTEFRLIYPPHPAANWRPEHLADRRILGRYWAQYKYDDWRTLLYFFPDGHVELYGRKKTRLPRYQLPGFLKTELKQLDLRAGCFHVLDGGLMHYKTERIKDTLVIWDALVLDGEYLVGSSFQERYGRLAKIAGNPAEPVILDGVPLGLRIAKHLWLAPVFVDDFKRRYEEAVRLPEIEGLVLKDPLQPLRIAFRMEENASWMVRARKPAA